MIISSDGIAVLLSATLEDLDCGELDYVANYSWKIKETKFCLVTLSH